MSVFGVAKWIPLKKNSEAIDLAIKMSFKGTVDYKSRIKKVSGCIRIKDSNNSIDTIRYLRDGK